MKFNLNDVINLYVQNWEVDKRTQGVFYKHLFIMAAYLTTPVELFDDDDMDSLNAVFNDIADQMQFYFVSEPSDNISLEKVRLDTYWFSDNIPLSLLPMYMRMLYYSEEEGPDGDYWRMKLELCFIGKLRRSCSRDLFQRLLYALTDKSLKNMQYYGQNSVILNLLRICKAHGHFKSCTYEEKDDYRESNTDILTEAREKWKQRNKSCSLIEIYQLEQALEMGITSSSAASSFLFLIEATAKTGTES